MTVLPVTTVPQSARWTVPADPAQVGIIRRAVVQTVLSWQDKAHPDSVESLRLIVSEMLTNAILHVGGVIAVDLWLTASGAAAVMVTDTSPAAPYTAVAHDEAVSGRGMSIVAKESDIWGWRPDGAGGKHIYASVGLSGDQAVLRAIRQPAYLDM